MPFYWDNDQNLMFQFDYVMMDGAPYNRSLIKELYDMYGCYSTPNPSRLDGTITYIMDPKVKLSQWL